MATIEQRINFYPPNTLVQKYPVDNRLDEQDEEALIRGDTVPLWEASISMRNKTRENPPEDGDSLSAFIDYFDHEWFASGLPRDWFLLKRKVGFSMNSQMGLLENTEHESVEKWVTQTEKDIRGFALEYLSTHLVYPCKYVKDSDDPTRLIDPKYGGKDMLDMVSDEERNGSVKESLGKIKTFHLSDNTPDNSIAVMTSPMGASGLTTDDGNEINYPDSYFFIMQKNGDTVTNFTVKTDFNLRECREALFRLTGSMLPVSATIEDYVRAVATFKPGEESRVQSVSDVVRVLEDIRSKGGSAYAFQNVRWQNVYEDIKQEDNLYKFNEKTNQMLEDFKEYCMIGNRTDWELQKALAATILRISKLLLSEDMMAKHEGNITDMEPGKIYRALPLNPLSFGMILDELASRPGCAGGGMPMMVNSISPRLGIVGFENANSKCKECERSASDNHYHCPINLRDVEGKKGCGKFYEDETSRIVKTPKCRCGFIFNC